MFDNIQVISQLIPCKNNATEAFIVGFALAWLFCRIYASIFLCILEVVCLEPYPLGAVARSSTCSRVSRGSGEINNFLWWFEYLLMPCELKGEFRSYLS